MVSFGNCVLFDIRKRKTENGSCFLLLRHNNDFYTMTMIQEQLSEDEKGKKTVKDMMVFSTHTHSNSHMD